MQATLSIIDADDATVSAQIVDLERQVRREIFKKGLEVQTNITKSDRTSQSLNETLTVILSAPAILILARALRDWAVMNRRATLELNGHRLENIDQESVVQIVKILEGSQLSSTG